jgi:hypothetical protein
MIFVGYLLAMSKKREFFHLKNGIIKIKKELYFMKIGNIKITLQGDENLKINFNGNIGLTSLDVINKEEAKLFLMKEFKKILDENLEINE